MSQNLADPVLVGITSISAAPFAHGKSMGSYKGCLAAWAKFALLSFACPAIAQDATPGEEANRFLEAHQKVPDMGPTPFGESVNLYTGELTFKQTDLVLTGIGPDIVIARTTHSSQQEPVSYDGVPSAAFGTWDLSIPRIETLLRTPTHKLLGTPGENWKAVGSGNDAYARCSVNMVPWNAGSDWWRGIHLISESGDEQPILLRSPSNQHSPDGQTAKYRYLTLQEWQIGCLGTTINGEPGQAFQALSPAGVTYDFNYLVGARANTIVERDYSTGKLVLIRTGRMLARMYVTRVQDRFGNYVNYTYSGANLTDISASDGRHVRITWRLDSPLIDSITAQPNSVVKRTWRYGYTNNELTSVTEPDGSTWTYSEGLTKSRSLSDYLLSKCSTRSGLSNQSGYSVSVTSPSGLVGTFNMLGIWHGRSYVPSACLSQAGEDNYEGNPPLFGTNSLISRTINGPGVPTRTWTHTYSSPVGSVARDPCASTATCPEIAIVDVTDPDGNRTRYSYSTRWGIPEGRLLMTQWFGSDNSLMRTETRGYASPAAGPYPVRFGTMPGPMDISNSDKLEQLSPVNQIVTDQQGRSFKWQVNSFDTYARPSQVTKTSSP